MNTLNPSRKPAAVRRAGGCLFLLALLAGVHQATAQEARFFRISGPAPTAIIAVKPDGTLVWSNALAGTTYTVQTMTSLSGGTNWVDYVQLPVPDGQGVNTNQVVDFNPPAGMALIPAGSFTMGDTLDGTRPEYDNAPVTAYVSAFYMDANLVSYSQWQQVYNWATNHGYGFFQNPVNGAYTAAGKAANHPVQTVDWYDCVKWCNARSEMEGRTPVYYTTGAQTMVYRTSDIDLSNECVNWTGDGYRLPTEAEWEKAARGGLSGQRFPWGNTISWSQANYTGDPLSLDPHGVEAFAYDLATAIDRDPAFSDGDSVNSINNPGTSPVGYFAPNGYGLYDMAGNVEEWCWDVEAWTYAGGSDPRGAEIAENDRVIRGGSWYWRAVECRTAHRWNVIAITSDNDIGFRCVLSKGQ